MRPPASSTRCCAIEARAPRRHGQRRGRRARRPVARAARAGRGRRLHAGLRRPARADLRARRVGAPQRLRGRLRRQGHEAPAGLSRGHARDGVGALRAAAGADARASTRRCSAPSSTARSRPSRWRRWRTRRVSSRRRADSASRPAVRGELAAQLRPAGDGGVLDRSGTLEVVSSLHADGSPVPGDLRWGVYVTVAAADRFVAGRVRRLRRRDVARRPRGRALAAARTWWGSSSA